MPGLLRFSSRSEACPRQCVHKMTTTIGYHVPLGLSSEKCEQGKMQQRKVQRSARTVPTPIATIRRNMPKGWQGRNVGQQCSRDRAARASPLSVNARGLFRGYIYGSPISQGGPPDCLRVADYTTRRGDFGGELRPQSGSALAMAVRQTCPVSSLRTDVSRDSGKLSGAERLQISGIGLPTRRRPLLLRSSLGSYLHV